MAFLDGLANGVAFYGPVTNLSVTGSSTKLVPYGLWVIKLTASAYLQIYDTAAAAWVNWGAVAGSYAVFSDGVRVRVKNDGATANQITQLIGSV